MTFAGHTIFFSFVRFLSSMEPIQNGSHIQQGCIRIADFYPVNQHYKFANLCFFIY